jgi:HNH endonuclease/AP2 domain
MAEHTVDHRDLDKSNNAIDNLRPATQGQNMFNLGLSDRNTSGFKGVSWDKRRKLWYAQMKHLGKHLFMGYHATAEAAHAAYAAKALELRGEFARAT